VSSRMTWRLLSRTETVIEAMAADRRHPVRVQLGRALGELAGRLQTDPVMRRRGEELKAELLAQPTVRELAANLWDDVKEDLRAQAGRPESELRHRLAGAIAGAGRRLADDPVLAAQVERVVETVIGGVLGGVGGELAGLVSDTIDRWDGADTARRLELLLGPDLQYIRINGTVVGALAGLALHAVTVAAG
jgi:uncharacterized membrane-anchored protein YjiN (DUF445 family)